MLVSTPEEFKTLVSKDHVIGYYKNNTRSKDHFESANCVPLDCDNTHSSDPHNGFSRSTSTMPSLALPCLSAIARTI